MEQPQYNMFVREKVEVEYSQIYKTVGLGTTIWSPLFSGLLTEKYIHQFPAGTRLGLDGFAWLKERNLKPDHLDKVRRLNDLAQKLGTTLPKLAIAWCVQNPNVSTAILGASRPEQLQETLQSLEVLPLLTAKVNEQIERILRNKPVLPEF
jgi:aryl-alcohol dehydrogenase-like predicted oxidoreductase